MQIAGVEPIPEDVRRGYVAAGLWGGVGLRDGVEAVAARTPDRVAVADGTTTWTYRELAAAVDRAVGCLRGHGCGPGTAVLVIAPLIAPAVAVYHAVLRCGGVAVMLDRRSGRADVVNAVEAAGVELIVTTAELATSLQVADLDVPTVSFDHVMECATPSEGWTERDPSLPAAIVFTSGTTSRPKAVVHSLDTLRAGARNMADIVEMTDADVAFLSTPLASITGLLQTHLTTERGAGLLLEDRFDAARSLARLRAEGATVLGGAPVIIEELFRQAQAEDLHELPLRTMALGGAMIPREILEVALDRYGIRPVRVYGSSEVPVSTGTLPSDEGEGRYADDGACAEGTEVRILGDQPGELLLRGPMRMLGYLDEGDNAEAFTDGGWYRTGDLGRFEDGRLTVTGRLKEIVSRKGLKISLTEIDDVARRLPGAEEVAAFGVPDAETGERLALAVVARDVAAVDFDSVTAWLLDAGLAKWKLPEQVVVWEQPLPRTESGKVQRRMLAADGAGSRTFLAPRLR
ncbi:class I adenylate-forming enzyme family protein [Trujillonella endophytica]|uniref:Acyl-CoA synthetase (AMP-forming)/AMP-acid ligase II n=1 Tax=Trujillonella endophytica TaxID=673521 RepID=A0A1H8Q5G7_9ACTN|nr:class I adenylate-forming enzyme family protein [Trujillella endophytica]SEO49154.1 Acyl-CoA synthetase (AMP-forming)/AMP-acid ligase II [Trujillella endophytica]